MGRILEKAEKEFLKRCASARKAAAQQAAKEIQIDFKEQVFDRAVWDYYDDYNSSKYKRSESLYDTFKVYTQTDGNNIGISYDWDFNRLPQYASNSAYHKKGNEWIDYYNRTDDDDNGVPEKGWIFTNFMEGIHPSFYLDKKLDVIIDNSYQSIPFYIRIKNYKEEYIRSGKMRDILIKNLKKQCKNI